MKKELQETKKTELTTQALADSGISTNDLLISRVGLMNALSNLVKSGDALIGDIFDTGAEEKLGDADTPVDFLVLKSMKNWHTEKDGEYVKGSRQVAFSQNDLPWEQEGGIKNIFNHSFYILLKKDLEDGIVIPFTINFKSTELKKAKRICTILYRMAQKGINSYGHWFSLAAKEERSGNNSWMGAKISVGEEVPQEMQKKALDILIMLNKAEAEGAVKHEEEKSNHAPVDEF